MHVYNNTPLIWVCLAKNNVENVRILFTYGSDINFRTIYNDNALHFSARYADSEIIEFLIMHDISVNIFNDDNDTPLAWACSAKGNIENV